MKSPDHRWLAVVCVVLLVGSTTWFILRRAGGRGGDPTAIPEGAVRDEALRLRRMNELVTQWNVLPARSLADVGGLPDVLKVDSTGCFTYLEERPTKQFSDLSVAQQTDLASCILALLHAASLSHDRVYLEWFERSLAKANWAAVVPDASCISIWTCTATLVPAATSCADLQSDLFGTFKDVRSWGYTFVPADASTLTSQLALTLPFAC